MDPDNFDPFDPGWLQAYDAMLQQQAEPAAPGAVDQVAHEDSEQHLAEEHQGGAAPIAGGRPPRSNPNYPHLSDNDENLINSALEAKVGHRKLTEGTKYVYANALRKLGNRLGERGQTIGALDHDSLLAHAKNVFSNVGHFASALTVLRRYREPDTPHNKRRRIDVSVGAAPVAGGPPRSNPNHPHLSDNDRNLIRLAVEADVACKRLTEGTARTYANALRQLGNHLGKRGQTIDALDHNSLVAYANEFFQDNPYVVPGLTVLRRYREPDTPYGPVVSVEDEILIDRAIQAAAARRRKWTRDTARRYYRVLRNLAKSLGPGQTITALDHESLIAHAKKSTELRAALQALREYRGSNTLADRGPPHHSSTAERGHIIDDATRSNQRTETTPPIGLDMTRASGNSNLGDGVSGAVGSWQMGEQAAHSPLQVVDPEELWQEADQAGQLPADSWDLANFWEGMPSSLSLSQQSSAPAAAVPAWPSPRDFGYLLPLQFDPSQFNGPQPAPGVLIEALDRAGLLPRPSQWPTNLSINTQPYTASFDSRAWEPAVNNPLGRQVIIQPVHDPSGSSAGRASRQPLTDIGPLVPPGGWERRESWLPNYAEPQVASCDQSQHWREANQIAAQVPAGWSSAWPLPSAQSDRNFPEPAALPSGATLSDLFPGAGYPMPFTPQQLRDHAHFAPAFPSTSSADQIGALETPSSDPSGRVLGAREWLGDQHIHRDYELLRQDLQQNNPDLAARTRLVDPLIAHYHLRLGSASVMLAAFQRIVNVGGNDTADFLFMPVSDASASDPALRGTHWSLLFVDRRDRTSPVAYHYDSNQGQNDGRAEMLAQRLRARREPVRMTQQENEFDCGVFVVDGTRALVGRLAQSQWPALRHLDNLVVDRPALQERLRGDAPLSRPPRWRR
ncbi:C48 family peptidase (plasmid) [Bradyrhizobium sp. CCGUVB1N3]|uniref:Ulp1 family isopeptidase n=1 Tax=Bradyrhizobium sp. CCGUVB1N3 TaxID=2949629 RepID=UPI0020B35FDC|nr:Ulp1 family isopeptidase [Bradyrhizobium sp. CCGUVB1N3]MCP3477999.1 C48 family peptidase [Bradyrhizobium sp. CCGUVB1N3]